MSWFDFSGGEEVGLAQPAWDFSGPEWGGWGDGGGVDYGALDIPDYSGYETGNFFGESGLMWDTTTGKVTGGGPSPFELQRAGERASYLAAPGAPFLPAPPGTPPGTPPTPPPGFFAPKGTLDKLLESNVGRLGGALGVGALGLGAQQLIAGRSPTYRPPAYTPSPVAQAGQTALLNALQGPAGPDLTRAAVAGTAGQAALAEQVAARVGREAGAEAEMAPGQRNIRMASLQDIQRLMPGGVETPIEDPVRAALRQELLAVLSGGQSGVSPATARRQGLEEQEVRARLYHQLGPDYELTTPGIQALNMMQERHNAERFGERQQTIAAYGPQEAGRMQFATTAPTELLARREAVRRGALQDAERLGGLGIAGAERNVTSLGQIVPVQTLLGGDPNRPNEINTQLQAQAGLTGYQAANQRQRDLAAGVGGLFGTVAGTVGARPSAAERYYEEMLGRLPPRSY